MKGVDAISIDACVVLNNKGIFFVFKIKIEISETSVTYFHVMSGLHITDKQRVENVVNGHRRSLVGAIAS